MLRNPTHRPKGRRHRLIDQPGALQQRETVLAVLGQPQLPGLDQVIGDVDADLAGTLYVQGNRVLPEIIFLEGKLPFMAQYFRACAIQRSIFTFLFKTT
jgi:hypothetical protein